MTLCRVLYMLLCDLVCGLLKMKGINKVVWTKLNLSVVCKKVTSGDWVVWPLFYSLRKGSRIIIGPMSQNMTSFLDTDNEVLANKTKPKLRLWCKTAAPVKPCSHGHRKSTCRLCGHFNNFRILVVCCVNSSRSEPCTTKRVQGRAFIPADLLNITCSGAS